MAAILPTASQFRDRLQKSGWDFAVSFALVLCIAAFAPREAATTIMLLALSVTLINLGLIALNAGFPHMDGFFCRSDMAAMPPHRRYINYALEGLWTTLFLVTVSIAFGEPDSQLSNGLWVLVGLFFIACNAFFGERRLRESA